MVQKVRLNNLFIVKPDDPMSRVRENCLLSVAVTRVFHCVVDGDGRLAGIVSRLHGGEEDDRPVSDYMRRSCRVLVDDGSQEQAELARVAAALLAQGDYYLIPVVNPEGRLLYAFQLCNDRVARYKRAAEPRFSFAAVRALGMQCARAEPDTRVYLCSDLGRADNSVDVGEIAGLEKGSLVIIGFDADDLAQRAAEECARHSIRYNSCVPMDRNGRLTDGFRTDPFARAAFEEIAQENGRYFDWQDFDVIFQMLRQTRGLEGDYVEIGVYRGDSARAALEYMKQAGIRRNCFFLDTYEGFNYEAALRSADSLWAGGHADTSIDLVRRRLSGYPRAKCIRNNVIADEFPREIGPITLCNIDVDLCEAYEAALEKVSERLVPGGAILAEDFGHTPALLGGQGAILRFAEAHRDEFFAVYGRGSQLLLLKR